MSRSVFTGFAFIPAGPHKEIVVPSVSFISPNELAILALVPQ